MNESTSSSPSRSVTLKELSEAATPGPISLNPHDRLRVRTSMDHPMCEFSNAYHRLSERGEGQDPEFMVALWNAYRSGELRHVSEKQDAGEPMVCIPRSLAAFVRKVWLPANPNKLRNCHPSTILNAKRFIQAVDAAHLKDGADFNASVHKASEEVQGG